MKKPVSLLLIIMLPVTVVFCQPRPWDTLVSQFVEDYEELDIEPLRLAYLDNLAGIQSPEAIRRQAEVFEALRNDLNHIEYEELLPSQRLEYDLLQYHLSLNEERARLEQQWNCTRPPGDIPSTGLASLPNGKALYAHFLKRWVDASVTPDALFEFGMSEIEKVQSELKRIQERSGMDSLAFQQHIGSDAFFYKDVDAVQQAFENYSEEVIQKLSAYFPGITAIPDIRIRRGALERMAQVPAYYSDNTLFYNFFGRPFNKRQVAWVYLHEALPGHHYERSYSRSLEQSPVQRLFYNPGYSEGWAAYVEEIGNEIGAYRSIYDELGKWEWDIIRSVRVPLDVGLNYYGWSDEQALAFWRRHITGQDDIGRREIARMKRWPCQVVTYKYGADKLLRWKARFEEQPGFSLMAFHAEVLKRGPLPFSILEGLILKEVD